MVDTKFTDLTAAASVAGPDILAATIDPGGTPLARKVTATQLARGWAVEDVQNASASTEIDFNNMDSSHEYHFSIIDLIPNTDADNLLVRFSTNNGVSFDSSSIYTWQRHTQNNIGGHGAGGNQNVAFGEISDTTLGKGTGETFVCECYMQNHAGSKYKILYFNMAQYTDIPQLVDRQGMVLYANTTAVDAIRFYTETSTMTTGKFIMRSRILTV